MCPVTINLDCIVEADWKNNRYSPNGGLVVIYHGSNK